MAVDNIPLVKAVLWEEAKGKLRTIAKASDQSPNRSVRDFNKITEVVEEFIDYFESYGYQK